MHAAQHSSSERPEKRPGAATATIEHAEIDRVSRHHRRRVFAGIFVGYAAYYLVRNNLAISCGLLRVYGVTRISHSQEATIEHPPAVACGYSVAIREHGATVTE